MIAQGETLEYAAEIPFTLPLVSDPLTGITGWAFTLGEVQIKFVGDLLWTDVALVKIVEKGFGRFCARLTAGQTANAAVVAIKVDLTGSTEQPYFGSETIGVLGGDVPVNGTGYFLFYLSNDVDPVYGAPVSTADFTAFGTLRVCLPNDVYRDATPGEKASIVNIGNGVYAFPLTTAHTSVRGKMFLYASYPGAQRFEGYSTILGAGLAPGATTSAPIAVPSPIAFADPSYVNHIRAAINRLPQQFKSGIYVPEAATLDMFLNGEL